MSMISRDWLLWNFWQIESYHGDPLAEWVGVRLTAGVRIEPSSCPRQVYNYNTTQAHASAASPPPNSAYVLQHLGMHFLRPCRQNLYQSFQCHISSILPTGTKAAIDLMFIWLVTLCCRSKMSKDKLFELIVIQSIQKQLTHPNLTRSKLQAFKITGHLLYTSVICGLRCRSLWWPDSCKLGKITKKRDRELGGVLVYS